MFDVTEDARARLLDLLQGVRPKAGQALRLTQKTPQRIGLAIDWEREGDQLIYCSERIVLLIEPDLAALLSGAALVVEPGLDGQRLGLRASDEPTVGDPSFATDPPK